MILSLHGPYAICSIERAGLNLYAVIPYNIPHAKSYADTQSRACFGFPDKDGNIQSERLSLALAEQVVRGME